MKNLHLENFDQEIKKREAYSHMLHALAKANLKFGLSFNDTVAGFKQALLDEATKMLPGAKQSTIANITGFNRKAIPKIALQKESPSPVVTNTAKALHALSTLLKENNTNRIPINGKVYSFKRLINDLFKGQESHKTMIDNFIFEGCAEIDGDELVLNTKKETYQADPVVFMNFLGRELNSIMDTAAHNFDEPIGENKKFQRARHTSSIPPERVAIVEKKITEILRKAMDDVDEILIENEEKDGKGQAVSMETYDRVGVFANIFSSRPISTHKNNQGGDQ